MKHNRWFILAVGILIISQSPIAEGVDYFCIQIPGQFNQQFESSSVSRECNGKTKIQERHAQCIEQAACAAITPNTSFKSMVEGISLGAGGPKYDSLKREEIGQIVLSNPLILQTQMQRSFLICPAAGNGTCPSPNDCQSDVIYKVSDPLVVGGGEASFMSFPKKSQGQAP